MKRIIIGTLLLLLGVALISLSYILNTFEKEVITALSVSLSHGTLMNLVESKIHQVIAGGTITAFPRYFVYLVFSIGGLLSYFGLFSIINKDSKKGISLFFTKEYWSKFQKNIPYHESKIKKVTILKKKRK